MDGITRGHNALTDRDTNMLRTIAAFLITVAAHLDTIEQTIRAMVVSACQGAQELAADLRRSAAAAVETTTEAAAAVQTEAAAITRTVRSVRISMSITYTDRSGRRPRTATAASASATLTGVSAVIAGRPIIDSRPTSSWAPATVATAAAVVKAAAIAAAAWSAGPILIACAAG